MRVAAVAYRMGPRLPKEEIPQVLLPKLHRCHMTNNTPTPAQALGECLEQIEFGRDGSYSYCTNTFAPKAAWFFYRHGQHFAGLEAENATAISDVSRLLSRTVELNDALDSAAARVLELESALLRYGRHEEACETRHDSAYKPKPKCTCGFAAILAARG